MIQLLTFNLRCSNPSDGINFQPYRMPRMLEKIREARPDVIGFQEMRDDALPLMSTTLTEYMFIGTGRDATYFGESTRIAFRRDKFLMLSMDQFWLSDTPRVPGSRYTVDQSSCPRVCTWVKLFHLPTQQRFYFLNTHLDHVGEDARMRGLQLVIDTAKQLKAQDDIPVIITGDFNFTPDAAPYALIEKNGLVDLTEGMAPTFHGFGRANESEKIDYILTDCPREQFTVERWHECNDGVYLSDHDPICAKWTF